MTVSGRFPENSEILKTLRPHLLTCSSSCNEGGGGTVQSGCVSFPSLRQKPRSRTHLGQFVLLLRLDAEARNVGVGEAGGVLQLLHAADLRHGLIFSLLLLLGLRLRHLHFMLLVWWDTGRKGFVAPVGRACMLRTFKRW